MYFWADMKTILNIVGAILVVFGVIWILQGENILKGSFMTGRGQWTVYGGVAAVLGIILLLWSSRRRSPRPPKSPPGR